MDANRSNNLKGNGEIMYYEIEIDSDEAKQDAHDSWLKEMGIETEDEFLEWKEKMNETESWLYDVDRQLD